MYPSRSIAAAVCLAAAVGAAPTKPKPTRFALEFGFRFGMLGGQILEPEEAFYKDVGLHLVDDKGKSSAIDLIGSSLGMDLGAYLRLHPSLGLGVAFVNQSTNVQATGTTDDQFSSNFLSAYAFVARARFQPVAFDKARLGLELGAGPSYGTIKRYGLAVKHMGVIRDGILESTPVQGVNFTQQANEVEYFARVGNRSLDLSGMRYEAALVGTWAFNRNVGWVGRIGYHRTDWAVEGVDPLQALGGDYPAKRSDYGVALGLGMIGSF